MDKDLNARLGSVKLPEENRRRKLHGGRLGNDFLDVTTVDLIFPLCPQAPVPVQRVFRHGGQGAAECHGQT